MDGVGPLGNAQLGHACHEAVQVACHARAHGSVQHGGGKPLVLAEFRQYLARQADICAGHDLFHDGAGALLVRRIAVGMQEADRHRLQAGGAQGLRGAAHGRFVQWRDHLALRIQPLRHFDAVRAGHQHRRLGHAVVEQVRAGLPADLQDVAEALGGDQAHCRAFALDDEIGGHGGAVAHVRHLGGRHAVLAQQFGNAALDGLGRVVRGGGDFMELHGPGRLVDHGEVGEGATDVDTDSVHVGFLGCAGEDGELSVGEIGSRTRALAACLAAGAARQHLIRA